MVPIEQNCQTGKTPIRLSMEVKMECNLLRKGLATHSRRTKRLPIKGRKRRWWTACLRSKLIIWTKTKLKKQPEDSKKLNFKICTSRTRATLICPPLHNLRDKVSSFHLKQVFMPGWCRCFNQITRSSLNHLPKSSKMSNLRPQLLLIIHSTHKVISQIQCSNLVNDLKVWQFPMEIQMRRLIHWPKC